MFIRQKLWLHITEKLAWKTSAAVKGLLRSHNLSNSDTLDNYKLLVCTMHPRRRSKEIADREMLIKEIMLECKDVKSVKGDSNRII